MWRVKMEHFDMGRWWPSFFVYAPGADEVEACVNAEAVNGGHRSVSAERYR